MMATVFRLLAATALTVAVSLCIGCNKDSTPRFPLHGQVSMGGEPVADGMITLLPKGQTPGFEVTSKIVEGEYTIDQKHGPTVGSYRVEIEGFRKTGRTIPNLAGPGRKSSNPDMVEERMPIVPPKYNIQSELTAEITPDTKELNFHLERQSP